MPELTTIETAAMAAHDTGKFPLDTLLDIVKAVTVISSTQGLRINVTHGWGDRKVSLADEVPHRGGEKGKALAIVRSLGGTDGEVLTGEETGRRFCFCTATIGETTIKTSYDLVGE